MTHNLRPTPAILATDLDGTLIPLPDHPQNRHDLETLGQLIRENSLTLAFVTGRHLESVQTARQQYDLPRPDWIICDVGTSIYRLGEDGEPREVSAYQDHLGELIAELPIPDWREKLADLKVLTLQEDEKQGPYKLSYYTDATGIDEITRELEHRLEKYQAPYSLIASVDPFNGDGLIDFLPKNVSKAYALTWWSDHTGSDRSGVIFAGDSGNDTAALTAGFRAIVVGNAARKVARKVHSILQHDADRLLYLAKSSATSGVLEGCHWFRAFSEPLPSSPTLPYGATPIHADCTHFRVWAPKCETVSVQVSRGETSETYPMEKDEHGDFSAIVENVGASDCYQYHLNEQFSRPDPCSRYQPQGVHAESMVINPDGFPWSDQDWTGIAKPDLIIYEMHPGTFTPAGTFQAAIEELPRLKELGITAVEILPVVQTPGQWNWGYDGVNLFAVRNTYGTPDDLKAFIDACHGHGLAVLLDVVYNHVGPEGNYWGDYAPYYSDKHHTPWGDAFAFDGPHAEQVRQFIIQNALFWLQEYHFDGLRLDAVHCMYDDSRPHILEELRKAVAEFASTKPYPVHLIAEANLYDPELLPPDPETPACDAIWCDDVMHSIYSVITPETNVTHRAYEGPQDLTDSLEHGYIYQGMPQVRVNASHREQLGADACNSFRQDFVIALQNHDNVGNHPHGLRMHQLTSPAHQKAAAPLVLLYPAIPMMFMGEETANLAPFRFFVDFEDDRLRQAVDEGRAAEYPHQVWEGAISPSSERAFRESQLADSDDPTMSAWYQSLIELRKQWCSVGILNPRNFRSCCDPEMGLFGFEFTHADQTVFVLSRLSAVGTNPQPIRLSMDGEILLDSNDTDSLELTGPRAIVGSGPFPTIAN